MNKRQWSEWYWRRYWVEGRTFKQIGAEVGLSDFTMIHRFRALEFPVRRRGSYNPFSIPKITDDDLLDIRERYALGDRFCEIAAAYPQYSLTRLKHAAKGYHRRIFSE